jgi:hypothetical protein
MGYRRLIRDRVPAAATAIGLMVVMAYATDSLIDRDGTALTRAQRLLTAEPWYCEVHDPEGRTLVSSSIETFHAGGTLDGRTRLEDRRAGRVLLEFSYSGVWQFDDPWLTEAIKEYRYLHVDREAFSPEDLSAIEAEFAEPEVSRVHALTQGQLVYGAHQSLYQCHRRDDATVGIRSESESVGVEAWSADRFHGSAELQAASSSSTQLPSGSSTMAMVTPARISRGSTRTR